MKGKFAFGSCVEAQELSTKAEYNEVGFRDRLRLQLHLFLCKNCKKYEQQNQDLSELLKKAKVTICSEKEKQTFKDKILQHDLNLQKKQQDK